MQSEEREKIRKQAVTLIRSLLISTKGGVPIEKMSRDYREMIGKPIPWRDLGYVNLEEFLDQSPDMCRVSYTPTGIMIRGVVTSADAHVASLVNRQSSNKRRTAKTAKMPPARRPNTMQRPWQPPTPSQPFQRQNYQNRFQQSGRPPSNRPGGSGGFPVQRGGGQSNVQSNYHQQRLRTPYNNQSSNGQMNNGGPSGDNRNNQANRSNYNSNNSSGTPINRNRPNNERPGQQNKSQFQRPVQDQQQSQSNRETNQSKPSSSSNNQNQTPPAPKPAANQVNSIKLLEQYFSQNNLGELTFKTASVEVKSGGSGGPNQKNGNKGKKVTKFVSTVKVGEQSFQTFPNSYSTKEQAEEAASSFAISKLNISVQSGPNIAGQNSASNSSNSNNNNVMSMPIGHFEADPSAAQANGQDGGTPGGQAPDTLPPTQPQDIEPLIDKICGLVGDRYNGVWSTQVDVEFKRKYGKPLPEKWPVLIEPSEKASKKLRVDNPIEGRYIIYPIAVRNTNIDAENGESEAKNEAGIVPNASNDTTKKSLTSSPPPPIAPPSSGQTPNQQFSVNKSSQQPRPPKLTLPDDSNWYVYITCVHSTVNVCLRLLGDSYSSKFDDMVTNMELKYFESPEVPCIKQLAVSNQVAEVGTLYAAKVEGDWHRVEATNVHGLEVTCYFIDHGDEDVLKVKDLRKLLPEFMTLAPQAKSVRLAGLEDLAGDQNAQAELTNLSLGRSLVGQVHAQDESGISLILYDTNSDEDININEKIFRPTSKNSAALSPSSALNNDQGKTNGASSPPRLESPEAKTPPQQIEVDAETRADATEASAPENQKSPGTGASSTISESSSSTTVMEDLMSIDLASLKPLMPTNMTEAGEFLDVNITLAASPSNFTVQPWQNTTQLESFQAELNSFYHNPKNMYGRSITNDDVAKGDKFYAGQHMDGKWYRVKVNASIDEGTVAARIVDFGDFTMIPLESLQPLWPQFRNLPMQAISASLADIVATNGDWSTEDTIWFSERVVNSQFVTKILDVIYDPLDDNVRISVSLIDTTHPTTDIYIEKQLVEDKRAVYLCV